MKVIGRWKFQKVVGRWRYQKISERRLFVTPFFKALKRSALRSSVGQNFETTSVTENIQKSRKDVCFFRNFVRASRRSTEDRRYAEISKRRR